MTREKSDRSPEPKTERREERDSPERAAAPPVEREHETYAGVFEEDERREEKGERPEEDERSEREHR